MRPYWDEIEIPSIVELLRDAVLGNFDHLRAAQWARYHIPNTCKVAVVYLISIFAIQHFMKNRAPFKLQGALAAWNVFQCIVSILIVSNTLPELVSTLLNSGIRDVNCNTRFYEGNAGLWHFVFALSKVVDLADTYFLVLRKRPLIFLHYYHHAMVIYVGFYYYGYHFPTGRLVSIVNGFVHIWMYGYYAARALHFKVPGWIARSITSIQIIQFQFGFCAASLATADFLLDTHCHFATPAVGIIGWVTDFSFLVLFMRLYHTSYVASGGKARYRDSFFKKQPAQLQTLTEDAEEKEEQSDENTLETPASI